MNKDQSSLTNMNHYGKDEPVDKNESSLRDLYHQR